MKYYFCFLFVILFSSTLLCQDKVIKKEVTPTPEELEKLKNVDPKKSTFPTFENFKKEFKALLAFKRKYIPAPLAYTDPNTGFSFGAGVGIILYDEEDKIRHLMAPFVHYNQNTEEGITGRYIFIPTDKERYYYKISKSAKINEEYLIEYTNKKFYFENISFSLLMDIFDEGTSRFYGIGRKTDQEDRLNYNQREQLYQVKVGYVLSKYADINLRFEYLHMEVQMGADEGIAQVVDVYEDDPIIRKEGSFSTTFSLGLNVLGEIEEKVASLRLNLWGDHGIILFGEDELFFKWGCEANWFWQFSSKLAFAGAINYQEVQGINLPFYHLSTLGGSRSFRGYETGRFYDNNALQGMTELRWHVYHLHKFGFITDWELAFFYDFGQVGADQADFAFNHFEHAVGIGIRTHFGGNLLTRFDIGYGNEGIKLFVDFGYAF